MKITACFSKKMAALALFFLTAVGLTAQDWSGEYGVKPWTDQDEKNLENLFHTGGFYITLKDTLSGKAPLALLEPFLAQLNTGGLVASTMRDSLLTQVPPEGNQFLVPLLKSAPAGSGRDFALARRMNFGRYAFSPFNFSTYPVRTEMLSGTSMILPNYAWDVGEQTDTRETLTAYEKNFAATVQMVWINREGQSALKTAKDLQLYTSFRPGYLAHAPAEGQSPSEADLITIDDVHPQKVSFPQGDTSPQEVWEQIQTSPEGDAFQIYVGRTRYYYYPGKILVVTLSLHTVSNHILADKRLLVQKLGQLLDTLRIKP